MSLRNHPLWKPSLLFLCCLAIPFLRGQPPRETAVTWTLYEEDLGLQPSWVIKLAMDDAHSGWIGAGRFQTDSPEMVYRLVDGEWSVDADFPLFGKRASVLDVDDFGQPWVCIFDNRDELTYEGLSIGHRDNEGWHEEVVCPGIWPQVMDMVSQHEGWIGGNHGRLLHYKDGTWQIRTLDHHRHDQNILDLHMVNAHEGWAVGNHGLVAHFTNDAWKILEVPDWLQSHWIQTLDQTEDGSIFFAGHNGLIGQFDQFVWRRFDSGVQAHLFGIDMLSLNEGWAVGTLGTILKFNGESWETQPSPTPANLYDINMFSESEGWIVGEQVILKSRELGSPLFHNHSGSNKYPMARKAATKTASLDLNLDGYLDMMLISNQKPKIFKNNGDGSFREVPFGFGSDLVEENTVPETFALGDIDGDGDPDLFLGSQNISRLYINIGNFQFRDVTWRSGIEHIHGGALISQFIDLDNDGDLDFYLSRSDPTKMQNLLYLNDGTGQFHITDDSTGRAWTENLVMWGDLNGDHFQDLLLIGYVASEVKVLINNGKGQFNDMSLQSGLSHSIGDGLHTHGNLVDLDIDGDLDLVVQGDVLYTYLNDGQARFTRDETLLERIQCERNMSNRLGNFGDVNLDGIPDLMFRSTENGENSVQLLIRQKQGKYKNQALEQGLARVQGTNALLSDWDDDGDLDLFIGGMQNRRSSYFKNLGKAGHFLKIRLHGVLSNRLAIGASVSLYEAGHRGDPQYLIGYQQAGVGLNPFAQYNLSELHFGLPNTGSYDLEVQFPGGRRVVRKDLSADQTYQIHEYPAGLRHLLLSAMAGKRALKRADLITETIGLIFMVLLLASANAWLRRRYRATAILGNLKTWVLLLVTYVSLASSRFLSAHPLEAFPLHFLTPLAIMGVVVILLCFVDHGLVVWKKAHVFGHFRVIETLGEGGMAVVYRARDRSAKRQVALKVLHPAFTVEKTAKLRFSREARIIERLIHPNIVEVFEVGELNGRGFISMELLKGISMKTQLNRSKKIPVKVLLELVDPICDALNFIHGKDIVHRDVKAENIFILDAQSKAKGPIRPWKDRVKLTDFGLARSLKLATVTRPFEVLGTPAYMSPEQVRGERVDHRTDLYALGVLMYEALSGSLPFNADDDTLLLHKIEAGKPLPLSDEIHPDLRKIITKLMARDPDQRFDSVSALLESLRKFKRVSREKPRSSSWEMGESLPVRDNPNEPMPQTQNPGNLALLNRKVASFETFVEISRQMTDLQLDAALELMVNHIVRMTHTQRGVLMLQDPVGELHIKSGIIKGRKDGVEKGFSYSRSVTEHAMATGTVIMIKNVAFSEVKQRKSVIQLNLKAVMAIPLKTAQRVLGVIYVDTEDQDHLMARGDLSVFAALASQAAIAIENQCLRRQHATDCQVLEYQEGYREFEGIIYRSSAMDRLCKLIKRIAPTNITVLVRGETGTGKELVSHAIHNMGMRKNQKLICINAGALADTILESELFGHRRGAFSGALEHKVGLFESAHNGTVFLDEIGEASPALQVRLLRFLETGTFRRVGETQDRKADIRIIAATHRDLEADVKSGRFRQDLYYRLCAFTIDIPTLEARREDIPDLIRHFMQRYNLRLGKNVQLIPKSTETWLVNRDWRGNVRELKNLIYRMMIFSQTAQLADPHVALSNAAPTINSIVEPAAIDLANVKTLAEVERDYMSLVLKAVGDNQAHAARLLGMHRNTFRSRLKKAGLLP